MTKKEPFIINRIKSLGFAFRGALLLLKNEASVQVQASIAVLVIIAGFYFEISAIEWMVQLIAIALVMSAEALNSAIEEIADFIHPEYHKKIGYTKDIAAGAVFFVGIAGVIIAAIIYIPKF